jgi:hypothetical protein
MTRIYAAAALLLMALSFAAGWSWRGSRAEAASNKAALSQSKAETAAQQDARATEHASAERANEIAESYERGKQDAQVTSDRVAADLRAGNLKLRNAWAGCETQRLSDATASASRIDAGADDRARSAGRIIAAGASCDAQVRGLQEIVRADRGEQ